MILPAALYVGLESKLEALDRRDLGYRFDIERDIPWKLADEAGDFAPPALISDLGYDAELLASDPAAFDVFQWAYCISVCKVFIQVEQEVVEFFGKISPELTAYRSNQILLEEEIKHIALFKRLIDCFWSRRPEYHESYLRAERELGYDQSMFMHTMSEVNALQAHFVYWFRTTHLEELTIHLARRYQAAGNIHPLWKAAHLSHMREEVQHVRTDAAHLEALPLDPENTRELGGRLQVLMARSFPRVNGTGIPERLARERLPAFKRREAITRTAEYRAILTAPTFRQTQKILARVSAAA